MLQRKQSLKRREDQKGDGRADKPAGRRALFRELGALFLVEVDKLHPGGREGKLVPAAELRAGAPDLLAFYKRAAPRTEVVHAPAPFAKPYERRVKPRYRGVRDHGVGGFRAPQRTLKMAEGDIVPAVQFQISPGLGLVVLAQKRAHAAREQPEREERQKPSGRAEDI